MKAVLVNGRVMPWLRVLLSVYLVAFTMVSLETRSIDNNILDLFALGAIRDICT